MELSALHTYTGHHPPQLHASGTPPHACWAQVSRQRVPQLLRPREALTACLCVAGGCQTSRAQIPYTHTARRPTPASGTSHSTRCATWKWKPVRFPVISDDPSSLPPALLMSQAPLHSRLLPLSLAAGSRIRSVDNTDVSIWLCFQDLWA